jgi:hypothetical protein
VYAEIPSSITVLRVGLNCNFMKLRYNYTSNHKLHNNENCQSCSWWFSVPPDLLTEQQFTCEHNGTSTIFWDIGRARNQRESRWLPAWRWRRYVHPKRRLTFNGLHGVISQNIVLFITTAVITSNPTYLQYVIPEKNNTIRVKYF